MKLTDDQRRALRTVLTNGMENWSEQHYAAGWLSDLEHRLWHEADWHNYGLLLGEWPLFVRATHDGDEFDWLPINEWRIRHRAWHAEANWRRDCPAEEAA